MQVSQHRLHHRGLHHLGLHHLGLHENTSYRRPALPAARTLLITGGLAFLGFLLVAALVLAAPRGDALDAAVYQFVETTRTGVGAQVASVATAFGSYQFVIIITVVFAGVTLAVSRRLVEPAVLLLSAPFTSSLVYLIKLALGRPRPPSALLMGEAPTDYSFPSGHTTSGTVLFVLGTLIISSFVLRAWIRRLLRVGGALMAIGIGVSRVYLGYHWTTDVLAGWLLAGAVVAAATLVVVAADRVRTANTVVAAESEMVAVETVRTESLR